MGGLLLLHPHYSVNLAWQGGKIPVPGVIHQRPLPRWKQIRPWNASPFFGPPCWHWSNADKSHKAMVSRSEHQIPDGSGAYFRPYFRPPRNRSIIINCVFMGNRSASTLCGALDQRQYFCSNLRNQQCHRLHWIWVFGHPIFGQT